MKILISPGFGAGWSTWADSPWDDDSRAQAKYMLTYQPIIDAIENGEELTEGLEKQFETDFEKKFGEGSCCYTGGFYQLHVTNVYGPFKVDEYDGAESLTLPNDPNWYDMEDF